MPLGILESVNSVSVFAGALFKNGNPHFSFGAEVSFATIIATTRLPKNPGTISKIPVEAVIPVNSQPRSITNPEMTPATAP